MTRRALAVVVLVSSVALAAVVAAPQQPRATSGGSPYSTPDVQDTNPAADIVETTITAEKKQVEIGGKLANALTFNGAIPGPTFRLKVNDTVIVHFENKLDKPTGIHWHGIELANAMDGTSFTQNQVAPNGSFLYRFKVTRPGLFWYHPHHHSSTNQVFKGLVGMVIVEDPSDAALRAAGALPSTAETEELVLTDTTVCKASGNPTATYDASLPHVSGGALPAQLPPTPKDLCETAPLNEEGTPGPAFGANDIPNIQRATAGRTNEGNIVLTNGKNVGPRAGNPAAPGAVDVNAAKRVVRPGQGIRLQIVNAAAVRYFRLRLTGNTGTQALLYRVGGEGGLLDHPVLEGGSPGGFVTGYGFGEVLVAPGTRADVVAEIPSNATGTLTLWTEDYQRTGQGYSNIPTVPVAHLQVSGAPVAPAFDINTGTPLRTATGAPVETLPAPNAALLAPAAFQPVGKKGDPIQVINLTAVANTELRIDNTFGAHDFPGDYTGIDHLDSSRYALEGKVYGLSVKNTTSANHPFHLHGFSIQPLTLTKAGDPTFTFPREFRDNVDIPPLYTLNYRLRTDARPQPDGQTAGGTLGRWVFHCHIFFHAALGMLSELVIVGDTNGNERPDVNVASSGVKVNGGDTATMNGTFKDRDNDAVTLTASAGTVTKGAGATFAWQFPTGTADTQIVTITATDAKGAKSQAPFFVEIANQAPGLNVPGAQTVEQGQALSFGVTGVDPNAPDPLALSASGLPAGVAFKDNGDRTGTASGVVTAAAGDYVATISVSDGKNAAVSATVPIKVLPAETVAAVLDRPERLVKSALTVACRTSSKPIQSCAAEIFDGKTRVGSATATRTTATDTTLTTRVVVSKSAASKIKRALRGRDIVVNVTARVFGSATDLKAGAKGVAVAPVVRATLTFTSFARGGSKANKRTQSSLKALAKAIGNAKRVTCSASPDNGLGRARSLSLSRARAKSACAVLRKAGLKAKFATAGRSRPVSRRSASRNRKLTLTIER